MAGTLDVEPISQKGEFWCWAASSEMVLDYLAPTPLYKKAVGQCSLRRSLPQGACDCPIPDEYLADKYCNVQTPFGAGDFLPYLLGSVKKTPQSSSWNLAPIGRELLACEIEDRKRPVITWWRNKPYLCEQSGHLVVVSGFEKGTSKGDLVLIHDPWPVNAGNSYWLTWRGYACGPRLGGHCVDYYDIRGADKFSMTCPGVKELDDSDCDDSPSEPEFVYELSAAEAAITELLQSQWGPSLRKGLRIPESVRSIDCNERIRIHGARLDFLNNDSISISKVGTTRLLCELQGEAWKGPASIFLINRDQGGWLLAGFGATQTTQWLLRSADPLVSALSKNLAAVEPIDLYEVEIPGTGDLLLILGDPSSGNLTIHYQSLELAPRKLHKVLDDKLTGSTSETIGSWLQNLPRIE